MPRRAASPTYLAMYGERVHYSYKLVIEHRGIRREKWVKVLSDHPDDWRASLASVHTHRETTAQAIRDEIDAMFEPGTTLTGPTLQLLADAWLEDAKRRHLRVNNISYQLPIVVDTVEASIRERVESGDREPWSGLAADVTVADVRAWIATETDARGWSARTSNGYLSVLSSWYNAAIDADMLEHNPVDKVRRRKIPKKTGKAFTVEQVRALIAALDDLEHHYATTWHPVGAAIPPMRGILLTAIYTGARPANVHGLQWEWVDLEHNLITWPASEFKTDRDHVIPLLPQLRAHLAKIHADGATGPVFPNELRGGDAFKDTRASWRRLKEFANKRLAKDGHDLIDPAARFQHLRHTTATLLLNEGVSVDIAAALLGNNPDTLRRFYAEIRARAIGEQLSAAVEGGELESLFGGSANPPKNPPKATPKAADNTEGPASAGVDSESVN